MIGKQNKNVTYNTFSFSQIQKELAMLHSVLNSYEQDPGLLEHRDHFFLSLFDCHLEENSD